MRQIPHAGKAAPRAKLVVPCGGALSAAIPNFRKKSLTQARRMGKNPYP
jgi:hypothetical protein